MPKDLTPSMRERERERPDWFENSQPLLLQLARAICHITVSTCALLLRSYLYVLSQVLLVPLPWQSFIFRYHAVNSGVGSAPLTHWPFH